MMEQEVEVVQIYMPRLYQRVVFLMPIFSVVTSYFQICHTFISVAKIRVSEIMSIFGRY